MESYLTQIVASVLSMGLRWWLQSRRIEDKEIKKNEVTEKEKLND